MYFEREVGCECLRCVKDEELSVIVVAHSGQLQAEPIQEQLHTLLQDLRVQGVQHNTLHIIFVTSENMKVLFNEWDRFTRISTLLIKKTIPGSHMKMLKWFWEIFSFHQDTGKNVWVGLHIK